MKLVTFAEDGQDKVGALRDDRTTIVDLSELFGSMLELIDGGEVALEAARRALDGKSARTLERPEVTLRAPVPVPRQVRDCMVFEKHVQQAFAQGARMKFGVLGGLAMKAGVVKIPKVWYEQPIYYKSNRFSVIGPDEEIQWPSFSEKMDFECEMGMILGKTGKDIPRERALEHVFGFCVFNDVSARDVQFREMDGRLGPAKGKDFDTGNVIGPWLTTLDEVADSLYDLTMSAKVNGELWGRGNSGDMHHRWEDILVHLSRCETLHAGELIGSGTVGDGCGLEHGRFLNPGDVIELEIEGLGVLKNRIVR